MTQQSSECIGVTYRYLKTRCAAAGTSLKSICEEAGIVPQALTPWKSKDPKSIETLRKLEAVLDKLENKTKE